MPQIPLMQYSAVKEQERGMLSGYRRRRAKQLKFAYFLILIKKICKMNVRTTTLGRADGQVG